MLGRHGAGRWHGASSFTEVGGWAYCVIGSRATGPDSLNRVILRPGSTAPWRGACPRNGCAAMVRVCGDHRKRGHFGTAAAARPALRMPGWNSRRSAAPGGVSRA
ncbi:hypothetical protein APASM_2135 [Actinosynnema pretiosum subsp. pretiosum]|nr:hypothetical protein APASM_2135 [Actinosynnema pretiosum subsp. pretiosum]